MHGIDGDTLRVDGTTIRIFGIDAPEAGQKCRKPGRGTWRCGQEAIAAMEGAVAEGNVTCVDRGKEIYGRALGVCKVAGLDLGRLMVKEGMAWAFRRYSNDYAETENQARAAGVGVWEQESETPWDYRAHRWEVAKQEAPNGCPIKGNINRKGEHIYHAPWSPWYAKTKVSVEQGERWFCDEGEAIAAGWRAPFWGR
ncbi:thermonuclease family protein [Kaistia terrae]|uniref:Thermonuclease family protein n=1 Tax=Kaistia terrae TaxID=537017 RepID=A0ABW0Q2G8_9HYPH|nr:thermonuclease family protein [Kaistia terrae]MCX5581744.1 thermonuclease family protein [Kaistia terrae]